MSHLYEPKEISILKSKIYMPILSLYIYISTTP
jgi:hypothetical protein